MNIQNPGKHDAREVRIAKLMLRSALSLPLANP